MAMFRRDTGSSYQLENSNSIIEFFKDVEIRIQCANPYKIQCTISPPLIWECHTYKTKTRLDVNLNKLAGVAEVGYAKIRIVLEEPNTFFMPEDCDGKRYAITVASELAQRDIFDLRTVPDNPTKDDLAKELSFFCKIAPQGTESVHGFNIGLIIREAEDPLYEMPVILDPKVRNDGG